MPEPIAVAVLGRLAVDQDVARTGHRTRLVPRQRVARDAAAEAIGIRGMLVHAISDEAKAFYPALGLSQSPLEPMTLMVTLADLRATL